jgi:hypothetical protein
MAFHGQGVYLKCLAQRSPHLPSILEAQSKITDACKTTPFKTVLVFDYYPMHKVRSVPDGVTAFRREDVIAVIVLMLWKAEDDKEDKLTDRARGIANEIVGIMNKGQQEMFITESESLGYSNYGGFNLWYNCACL